MGSFLVAAAEGLMFGKCPCVFKTIHPQGKRQAGVSRVHGMCAPSWHTPALYL